MISLSAKGKTVTRHQMRRQLRSGYRRGLLREWEVRRLEDALTGWPASKVETAYRRLVRPRYRRQAMKFWMVLAIVGLFIMANWWLSSGHAATTRETCILDYYIAQAYAETPMQEIRTRLGAEAWQRVSRRTREILERDRLVALREHYEAGVHAGAVVDHCPR